MVGQLAEDGDADGSKQKSVSVIVRTLCGPSWRTIEGCCPSRGHPGCLQRGNTGLGFERTKRSAHEVEVQGHSLAHSVGLPALVFPQSHGSSLRIMRTTSSLLSSLPKHASCLNEETCWLSS